MTHLVAQGVEVLGALVAAEDRISNAGSMTGESDSETLDMSLKEEDSHEAET